MPKNIWILGITGVGDRFHDNSVCLVKNDKIVFAASEERYTRIKHDSVFPKRALKAALTFAGINRSQIAAYASGWPPLNLKKALLVTNRWDTLRSGLLLLKNSKPKTFKAIVKLLSDFTVKEVADDVPKSKHKFIDHYLAHAASAYRTSGLEPCLAVIWDGFGTRLDGTLGSGAVYRCQGGEMREVETQPLEVSLGLFYEAVTNALGFVPAEGEGKTMGLAAYGDPYRFLVRMKELAPRFEKGKWRKSQHWPETLFAVDLRYKEIFAATSLGKKLAQMVKVSAPDTAAACQRILEQEAVKYFRFLFRRYRIKNFVTAGGVFLNVKMGKKLRELPFVEEFYVQPHAGDGGLALGAALEVCQAYSQRVLSRAFPQKHPQGAPFWGSPGASHPLPRRILSSRRPLPRLKSAALGDEFTSTQIKAVLGKIKTITAHRPKNLARYVARRVSKGAVVGWFQGRAEWGPRALGQRSVLADPRDPKIKERINRHLKKRDWFMPFAPSILEEKAGELLQDAEPCPFMTKAFAVTAAGRKKLAAAIHVDNTCRPQTVSKKTNPLYWQVISDFTKITGVPAILNTSFNRHGLPIVNSPQDALDHLVWGAVDELAIGPYIVQRRKGAK